MPVDPSDEELKALPNASSNADADFDAMVRAYYTPLYNFGCRFLGSEQAAEDAVQEVFLKMWNRRAEPAPRDPRAYLYQALRNECVMIVRRERRSNEVDLEVETVADDLKTEIHEIADLAVAAAQAIDELPPRCRLIFTMSREQDLTYNEIARVLDISAKTVENQIARALKLLRTRLAGYFGVAAALASAADSWMRLPR